VQFEEGNDFWWGSLLPMLVREAHEGVRQPEEVWWYAASMEVRLMRVIMV
jgi:hypothetical protein